MAKKQAHTVRVIDGVTHFVPRKKKHFAVKSNSFISLSIVASTFVVVITILLISHVHRPINLEKSDGIRKALSRHIIVPNETPIIATVTDHSALKTPFLQESENGDKIVIYEKAKKVVIYRPSLDRIVDIGPVVLDNIPKTN